MFDIIDGKVKMDPNDLAIPVFKKIYDSDKTKEKETAFKKISYIVFMYKWNSPYAAILDEVERDKILKFDIFGDENYQIDDQMKQTIDRYKQFIYTFSLQFLDQNILGAKKLMDFYSLVNWEELDRNGKHKYSSRDLAANLKEAGNILRSLESLKEQVKREELETAKIKGGNEVGMYEDAYSLKGFQQS